MMTQDRKVSVIGLGYVGLSVAIAFGRIGKVIAFDTDSERINMLKAGYDKNREVPDQELKDSNIHFTCRPEDLQKADFHIIAVPTPLDVNKIPDLSFVLSATQIVGKQLKKDDIVVYESSLYIDAVEEKCIPLLEESSKKRCKVDFFVGFSPERINPGDKIHTIENIPKIISAMDAPTLDILAQVYSKIIDAGVYAVSSIRTAEAIKIIENTQRDINIAYMNEVAMMLHKYGIDTKEVIEGMKTKWNYLPFQPGLVGGHCIGINSYYLTYKGEQLNYTTSLIAASRNINESVVKFILDETIQKLITHNVVIQEARIAVLGLTYKEDCPDLRDTKVIDIINGLKSYKVHVFVHDPIADPNAAKQEYNLSLSSWDSLKELDAIIIAVSHAQFLKLNKIDLKKKFKKFGLIVDLKRILDPNDFENTQMLVWQL